MSSARRDLGAQLELVRSGTAVFSKYLSSLTDEELGGATLLEGWSRKHLVGHVGFNARALMRLLDWAETGVETPMYASTAQREREIDAGAALDCTALREMFDETAEQLDEKWRTTTRFDALVRTAQGRMVPAITTVWMRNREVWVHAVDLDNGLAFSDLPEPMLTLLLSDVIQVWRRRCVGEDIILQMPDAQPKPVGMRQETITVHGTLPAVVQWATGRGAAGVHAEGGVLPTPPSWL
ncbi:maleylpyruvate isomerase family mycothiol-dependent enzyme [Mycolicibacterium litorale]|uniref:maleylpyruvate isomerase family mycothiol-dependent enzyme n=1 Tax=Mycolicibacterium litorale TaxID=758802 RepID=UPI003CFABD93